MTASGPRSRADKALLVLMIVTPVLLFSTLPLIFVVAPTEATMGLAQKIFFFHVPSAYAMYVGFVVSGVASALYLFKRKDVWDAWAVAGAEVGIAFCTLVLTTGPLWARKAWGVWWAWDPQLTAVVLAGLVFASYLALRAFGSGSSVEKRFAAGLAIVGILDLPIIHYAAEKWGGQHPMVLRAKGGGIAPAMVPALLVSFLAFTSLVALLIWLRARLERSRQRLDEASTDALAEGLWEEK